MHAKTIRPLSPAALICVAALAVASLFSGCATVTRGTTEQLTITSDPTGATVRLSNGFTGVTPATFTVPRKGDVMVSVWKDGYEQQDIKVTTAVAGAGTAGFVGNVLIGGIIGGGVDIATGATLSHTPNPVHAALVRKPDAAAPSTPVSPVPATTAPAVAAPSAADAAASTPPPAPAASVATESAEPPKPTAPASAPQTVLTL